MASHAQPILIENSAAAMSRRQPGVFFTINDSGNEPLLFALDTTGADRGVWTVLGAANIDWESAAIGPCAGTTPDTRGLFGVAAARLLSTTNAVESVNMQLHKIIKTRGHFPTDNAVVKLLFLAVRNLSQKWKQVPTEWQFALPHFALLFGDRFPQTID